MPEICMSHALAAPESQTETQLVPPLCFGCVDSNIYRGSYPKPLYADFLRHLELKTIVSIMPEPLPDTLLKTLSDTPLKYVHITAGAAQTKSKKKREVPILHEHVLEVLNILQTESVRPVYIHCLNGRQATSLIIACLRVTQGWSIRSAFQEFSRFCDYDRKDVVFVENFAAQLGLQPAPIP